MGRFSFNRSTAALVVASAALFVALGGPAWAGSLIGTSQIRNGAVTSKKIGRHQVKNVNIANGAVKAADIAKGAVTSAAVKRGSLTAADVASGAFLPADARAQDSKELGGKPATDYLTGAGGISGSGGMVYGRISVAAGQTAQLLNLGIALIEGSCSASAVPTLSYVSEVPSVNLVDWGVAPPLSGASATNDLTSGETLTLPNPSGSTQAVTFQAAFVNNGINRVATAWTTGQPAGPSDCLFIGQAMTTG
jgi:hypothetical protein